MSFLHKVYEKEWLPKIYKLESIKKRAAFLWQLFRIVGL